MSKITTFWDVIKSIIAWFRSRKEQKQEESNQAAQEISHNLSAGYQKIDQEANKQTQKEDLDSVQDDLNHMF